MLYDFFEICNRELKNFDSAKSFYKIAEKDFKNTGDVEYFTDFLSRLYKAQGKDNFKKITSFDFNLINKKENTTIYSLEKLFGIFKLNVSYLL